MKIRVIGHIDADCFYVSCERIRDKRLIGVPTGVLGNQGACVIARSYEMKARGVTVGMPIWKAKKLCPDGIYIKRDFRWYGVISERMRAIFSEFSDVVEFYSIDESFIDFGWKTVYPKLITDWQQSIDAIQKRILDEVGVPVSIGISFTRTLAKLFSDFNKPLGATVILDHESLQKILPQVPIEETSGIGRRLSKRLHALNIHSCADYIAAGREKIKRFLHKPGEELWYELQGKSIFQIRSTTPFPKSISRGGSIWGDHSDTNYIWGFLVRNLERLMPAMWRGGIEARCMTLVLCLSAGGHAALTRALDDYSADFSEYIALMKECFQLLHQENEHYCRVHLYMTDLRPESGKQLSLFSQKNHKELLLRTVRLSTQAHCGNFSLRSGATLFTPVVFKDATSNFEITDIEGKMCF